MTAKLKQSRWVKVHEPGQANHDEKENVMDIALGNSRCQAEAVFTVRSYRKAAYWLLKYLEAAQAGQIITLATEAIQTAAAEANREDAEVAVTGENWKCEIEKMGREVFKVRLMWTTNKRRGRAVA